MAAKATTSIGKRARAGMVRLVATNSDYVKLCKSSLKRLPTADRKLFDVLGFDNFADVNIPSSTCQTFFISRISDLPKQGVKRATKTGGRHLLFLEGMPIQAVASRLPTLDIRSPERLHVAQEESPSHVAGIVYRLLSGIAAHEGPQPIVDAWIENGQLVLLAPSFERLEVPLEKLNKLIGENEEQVPAFEIDEDGSFLYWPHADVHLGWDQFRQITDHTFALRAQARSRDFNVQYGKAIRRYREAHKLKQSEIEGVTDRHLRRIEHGQQAASKGVLEALAGAAGVSLDACLKELAAYR